MIKVDYIETWKEIMKSPSDFYRGMPKTGGYFYPSIFAAGSFAIALFFSFLLNPFILPGMDIGELTYTTIPLVVIILFVMFIIALFINAAILNITYKVLGGKGRYEGTVGLVCYATAALVLAWIPFIGWIFGIYQIYLYIVGGKFVHDMSMGRSAMASIMSTLLVLVFVVLVSLSGFV